MILHLINNKVIRLIALVLLAASLIVGNTEVLAKNNISKDNNGGKKPRPTVSPIPSPTPIPTPTPTPTPSPTPTPTPSPTPEPLWTTITAPQAGETLIFGETYRITWDSSEKIDKVSIGYKTCPSCLDWIVMNVPNQHYYDWTVWVNNPPREIQIQVIGYQTGFGSVVDVSDSFTVIKAPLELVSLSSDSAVTGTTLSLEGKSFGVSAGQILFRTSTDSLYGGVIQSWSNETIDVTVPGMLRSNQIVMVSVKTATGEVSNSLPLYISAGQPQLISIQPTNVSPGGELSIQGEDFGVHPGTVYFYDSNNQRVAEVTPTTWSNTAISLTIPNFLTPDAEYAIQVVTAEGAESSVRFSLSDPNAAMRS